MGKERSVIEIMRDERLHTHSLTNNFREGKGISHVFIHGHTQHYHVLRDAWHGNNIRHAIQVASAQMFVCTSFGSYYSRI